MMINELEKIIVMSRNNWFLSALCSLSIIYFCFNTILNLANSGNKRLK